MDILSIVLPTMRDRVFETLELFRVTTHYPAEVIVVTENKDLIIDLDEYSYNKSDGIFTVKYYYSEKRLGALNAWNYGLSKSRGRWIFPSGDDQKPHDNWFLKGLDAHRLDLGGYGVVGFNDLALDGYKQVATTIMYDRQFCIDHFGGVCTIPKYNYLWIDVELQERAKKAGKFVWLKDAVVEHLHPAHGKRDGDWIDDEKVVNNWHNIDQQIYEDRKARGFPNDFDPVITS